MKENSFRWAFRLLYDHFVFIQLIVFFFTDDYNVSLQMLIMHTFVMGDVIIGLHLKKNNFEFDMLVFKFFYFKGKTGLKI